MSQVVVHSQLGLWDEAKGRWRMEGEEQVSYDSQHNRHHQHNHQHYQDHHQIGLIEGMPHFTNVAVFLYCSKREGGGGVKPMLKKIVSHL